jgi:hypothetical protein
LECDADILVARTVQPGAAEERVPFYEFEAHGWFLHHTLFLDELGEVVVDPCGYVLEQNLKDRVVGFGPDVDSQIGVKFLVHLRALDEFY